MGVDPLAGFSFRVKIGTTDLAFRSVSGIVREIDTFTYQEGGLNDRLHVFQKPSSTERVLHLERGVAQGASHPFYLVGERVTSALRLEVIDSVGGIAKTYTFTGLVVKRWEAEGLDATASSLFIDKFDLAYEALEVG